MGVRSVPVPELRRLCEKRCSPFETRASDVHNQGMYVVDRLDAADCLHGMCVEQGTQGLDRAGVRCSQAET